MAEEASARLGQDVRRDRHLASNNPFHVDNPLLVEEKVGFSRAIVHHDDWRWSKNNVALLCHKGLVSLDAMMVSTLHSPDDA